MDGGPFRVPGPTDRRPANRPASTHRQSDEPLPVQPEPSVTPRATVSRPAPVEEKSAKRFILPIIISILVIAAIIIGWFFWSNRQNSTVAIDSSKYQAVFFTNGQVYFGKLHAANGEYLKLTDIYYLQGQQSAATNADGSKNPQETSTNSNDVQLIKLGNEIHGPEDEMVISKDQLLFYENLKPDGKVAQSIEKSKEAK